MSREIPTLMSTPMVRACLAGTKTQTRRLIRECEPALPGLRRYEPGDILWIREPYRFPKCLDAKSARAIAAMCDDANYSRPWCPTRYEADGATTDTDLFDSFTGPDGESAAWGKLRPSIFLPRWACRLFLRVEAVRVERLSTITEADAIAEGCPTQEWYRVPGGPEHWYRVLWDEINGARAPWDSNPWVFVVTFRKIEA